MLLPQNKNVDKDILRILEREREATVEYIVDTLKAKGYSTREIVFALLKLMLLSRVEILKVKVSEFNSFTSYIISVRPLWFILSLILPLLTLIPAIGLLLYLKTITGFFVSMFLPGYLILRVIRIHSALSLLLRLTLSVTLSISLGVIIGLLLNYTVGIRAFLLHYLNILLIYVLAIIALYNEYRMRR